MTGKSAPERIGLFGGTFDPVHLGHLQIASQLKKMLYLDEMRMVLAAQPALRSVPGATVQQRWHMLQLALQAFPDLDSDDQEIRRSGVSYSYDTVAQLREQMGAHAVIALCLGWDSLISLPKWYRWQELLELCAVVVVNRPHHEVGQALIHQELTERLQPVSTKPDLRPGEIVEIKLRPAPISATQIREAISTGEGILSAWLTANVADYIERNKLYGLQ